MLSGFFRYGMPAVAQDRCELNYHLIKESNYGRPQREAEDVASGAVGGQTLVVGVK